MNKNDEPHLKQPSKRICPYRLKQILHAHRRAEESVDWWKDWLTTSIPLATAGVIGLLNADWVRLPLWTWLNLSIVAALLFAMLVVYQALRQQRDALHEKLFDAGADWPFVFVPLIKDSANDTDQNFKPEGQSNDL